jgi:molybdopterin converting factor small subunit
MPRTGWTCDKHRPQQVLAAVVNVQVHSIGAVESLLGRPEIDMALPAGTTIDGLLTRLSELGGPTLAPGQAAPLPECGPAPLRVMINGRDIGALQDQQTILQDGDVVLVLTPIGGG